MSINQSEWGFDNKQHSEIKSQLQDPLNPLEYKNIEKFAPTVLQYKKSLLDTLHGVSFLKKLASRIGYNTMLFSEEELINLFSNTIINSYTIKWNKEYNLKQEEVDSLYKSYYHYLDYMRYIDTTNDQEHLSYLKSSLTDHGNKKLLVQLQHHPIPLQDVVDIVRIIHSKTEKNKKWWIYFTKDYLFSNLINDKIPKFHYRFIEDPANRSEYSLGIKDNYISAQSLDDIELIGK